MIAPVRRHAMSWFDKLFILGLPLVPKGIMRRFSRRYIAGEDRPAALRQGASLQKLGYRVTYDVLGEAVSNRQEVQEAVQEYHHLLDDLAQNGLERNVSLKPTQMGLLIDEDLCYETVADICSKAESMDAFVRFEMEDAPTVDGTLRVFHRLRRQFPQTIGCVLQSRLFRTLEDVQALLQEDAPLNVRLVKGIYLEPPEIAHTQGEPINQAFLQAQLALLQGGAFLGAATHDEKLIEALQKALQDHPEWKPRAEVQMLLGVREELRSQVRDMGIPVRVYVPYGEHWLPYVTRRMRKNPRLARLALIGLFSKREKEQSEPV